VVCVCYILFLLCNKKKTLETRVDLFETTGSGSIRLVGIERGGKDDTDVYAVIWKCLFIKFAEKDQVSGIPWCPEYSESTLDSQKFPKLHETRFWNRVFPLSAHRRTGSKLFHKQPVGVTLSSCVCDTRQHTLLTHTSTVSQNAASESSHSFNPTAPAQARARHGETGACVCVWTHSYSAACYLSVWSCVCVSVSDHLCVCLWSCPR